MVDREIDSLAKLDRALHYWRNFSFSKAHFNLDEAMKAIGTEDQNVEAFMDYPGRWVLTRVGETTPKAATFHTACVWRWGSDLETGNYVPPGETPPGKLLESRIQSEPGALCQFSYAVDTVHDKSLWNAQQKVEEYILQVKGFNRSKKPRRPWQDGSENNTSVYIMGSQMFFKRTKSTSRREASVKYKLHPWIEKAAKQSAWFPNPDRPVVLEPCNGVLRDINDSVPPYLRTGDLVWISFFVEFVIGINHWSTTFSPREIIRVGTVSSELVGDQPPGVTLLEGSEDRLRAGDKISIPEDFPMHLFESPLDAATSSVVQDSIPGGPCGGPSHPVQQADNEVVFGPEDGPRRVYHNRSRSGSPLSWGASSSPEPRADNDEQSERGTPSCADAEDVAEMELRKAEDALGGPKRGTKRAAEDQLQKGYEDASSTDGRRVTRSRLGKGRAL